MTGDKVRFGKALSLQSPQSRNRNGQDCRLGILSQLQLFFRAIEAELGERKAQSCVRFFKDLSGRRKLIGQILSHAHLLRALAGKEKSYRSNRSHRSYIFSLPAHYDSTPSDAPTERSHQHHIALLNASRCDTFVESNGNRGG